MHGEDYVCLGFLFGRKARVAYLSDVSRILPRTEHGTLSSPSSSLSIRTVSLEWLFIDYINKLGYQDNLAGYSSNSSC